MNRAPIEQPGTARHSLCRRCNRAPARPALRWLPVLVVSVLFQLCNAHPLAIREALFPALSHAQHLPEESSSPSQTTAEAWTSGLHGQVPRIGNKQSRMPFILDNDVRLCGFNGCTPSKDGLTDHAGSGREVDLSNLPPHSLLLRNGAQLEFANLKITGLQVDAASAFQGSNCPANSFARWLLHPDSQGDVQLRDVILEATGCGEVGPEEALEQGTGSVQAADDSDGRSTCTKTQRACAGSAGALGLVADGAVHSSNGGGSNGFSAPSDGSAEANDPSVMQLHWGGMDRLRGAGSGSEIASTSISLLTEDRPLSHHFQSQKLRRSNQNAGSSGIESVRSSWVLDGRVAVGAAAGVTFSNSEVRCSYSASRQEQQPKLALHEGHDGDGDDNGDSDRVHDGDDELSIGSVATLADAKAAKSLEEAGELQGLLGSRRSLLVAVGSHGRGPEGWRSSLGGSDGSRTAAVHSFGATASAIVLMGAVLASIGGIWLKRLLSCACMGPLTHAPSALESSRGPSRSNQKASASMARNSQNHTLSALSRFSAQLRKGDDSSVRDGSRRGSSPLLRAATEGSVRGGSKNSPATPPPLLKDLTELKAAGQGRLATTLQGIWNQQQRVVVKVLRHGEDCAFMMEQVGEVWTRLAHPNIVTCWAAQTFAASCMRAVPEVAELLQTPADPDSVLQTWIVLERCENGSLAAMLAQRHQQQAQVRRAAALLAGGAYGSKEGSQARQPVKRLEHCSRQLKSPGLKDAAGSAGVEAGAAGVEAGATAGVAEVGEAAPAAPPPAFPAIMSTSSGSGDDQPPAPISPGRMMKHPMERTAAGSGGSGNASGAEDGGEGSPPGLLPVAEMLSIAHDIASGLAYLHSLDLCHGDLRAENVLVQTVVLPNAARGAGNGDGDAAGGGSGGGAGAEAVTSGDMSPCLAAVDIGGLYGNARAACARLAVNDGCAGLAGGIRTVGEGLGAMYGSTGDRSDLMDASGAVAAVPPRPALSNLSSYSYANAIAASCVVQDSGAQAWSNSPRHSNCFMTGSTFASTVIIPTHSQAGVGGASCAPPSCTRGFDPSSVDDRLGMGTNVALQAGLGCHSGCSPNSFYLSTAAGAVGAGRNGQPCNARCGRSLLGAAAAAAQGSTRVVPASGAATLTGDTAGGISTAVYADGSMPSNYPLSSSAVAALSRGIGLNTGALVAQGTAATTPFGGAGSGHPLSPGPLQGLSNGCTSYGRRQSNSSLSAHNSGNDVSAMSKALSGLTAWPESPPLESRQAPVPTNATAASGGADANGCGGTGDGGANGHTLGTAAARSPGRRANVIGGLKSALSAPEGTVPVAQPAAPPTPQPAVATEPPCGSAAEGPRMADTDPVSGDAASQGLPSKGRSSAAYRPAGLRDPLNSTCLLGDASAAGSPPAGAVPPRIITARLDSPGGSSVPPSPGTAAAADDAAPSTPTGCAGVSSSAFASASGGGSTNSNGRSRTAVGLVCMIAGRQGRRCSAPPVVALPVIRKVAKLSDPWLSLARMPPDCAGGPWSPAAAVGATSGADMAHLPPELLLSGRLHPSSDVYSLAILMWRMLSATGEAPYRKLLPAEVAYKVVACGMRPALSLAIPEQLRRLVEDCWQSDPAARPTVKQVQQRLAELQTQASAMQQQWRERHALFGPVSTVPISAVAVVPLRGEQNAVAARWADAAGIKLQRSSSSFGGSGACGGFNSSRGDLSGHSLGQNSSRRLSGAFAAPLYASMGVSGSAAHLYQQPPPPTPPGLPMQSHFVTSELSNQSNVVSETNGRGSQSNFLGTSTYGGHLPVQPYNKRSALEPF